MSSDASRAERDLMGYAPTKRKRTPIGVSRHRGIRVPREDWLALRLASELADLQAANAHPIPPRFAGGAGFEGCAPAKRKKTPIGVSRHRGIHAPREDWLALRLASELADLQAANANPIPPRFAGGTGFDGLCPSQ